MLPISKNPPSHWPQEKSLTEIAGPWKVAHLKPRQEKAAAHDLIRLRIPYCCPFYTHVVRRKDNNKPRKTVLPAFPGYLTFAGSKENEAEFRKTDRVLHVLEVADQQRLVRELGWVLSACASGSPLQLLNSPDLAQGQRVKIARGPMRGFEGEVMTLQGKLHVIVSVEMFRQAISLEVGVGDITIL